LLETDKLKFYSINIGYTKLLNTDFMGNGLHLGLSTQFYSKYTRCAFEKNKEKVVH